MLHLVDIPTMTEIMATAAELDEETGMKWSLVVTSESGSVRFGYATSLDSSSYKTAAFINSSFPAHLVLLERVRRGGNLVWIALLKQSALLVPLQVWAYNPSKAAAKALRSLRSTTPGAKKRKG